MMSFIEYLSKEKAEIPESQSFSVSEYLWLIGELTFLKINIQEKVDVNRGPYS